MSEYRITTADEIIKSRRLNDKLTSGTLASAVQEVFQLKSNFVLHTPSNGHPSERGNAMMMDLYFFFSDNLLC